MNNIRNIWINNGKHYELHYSLIENIVEEYS